MTANPLHSVFVFCWGFFFGFLLIYAIYDCHFNYSQSWHFRHASSERRRRRRNVGSGKESSKKVSFFFFSVFFFIIFYFLFQKILEENISPCTNAQLNIKTECYFVTQKSACRPRPSILCFVFQGGGYIKAEK